MIIFYFNILYFIAYLTIIKDKNKPIIIDNNKLSKYNTIKYKKTQKTNLTKKTKQEFLIYVFVFPLKYTKNINPDKNNAGKAGMTEEMIVLFSLEK